VRATFVVLAALVACSGESVTVPDCEPRVVLANPGPSGPASCFCAVAGADSRVRLEGDEGRGELSVDVNAGESYEVVTCSEEWGAPTLEPCGGES
jgi:hypothetical protein